VSELLKTASIITLLMLVSVNGFFAWVGGSDSGIRDYILVNPDSSFDMTSDVNSLNISIGNVFSTNPITNFLGFLDAISKTLNSLFSLLKYMAIGWHNVIDGMLAPFGMEGFAAVVKLVLTVLEAVGIMYILIDVKNALRL